MWKVDSDRNPPAIVDLIHYFLIFFLMFPNRDLLVRSKRPNFVVYFTLWTGKEELGCLTRPGAVSVTSVLPPPLDQWDAGGISLAISTNDASRMSAIRSRSTRR